MIPGVQTEGRICFAREQVPRLCRTSEMKVLVLLLTWLPWIRAQYEACPHVDPTSSKIAIVSDRFHLLLYKDELEPLNKLVHHLEELSTNVRVFLYLFDASFVRTELDAKPNLFNPNYTVTFNSIPEMNKAQVWDFFRHSKNYGKKTSKILIIFSEFYITYGLESSIWELRKAGVEIFIVHYRQFSEYDLNDIWFIPPETHIFHWQKYQDPNMVLAELAKPICSKIQNSDPSAKRALFPQVRLADGPGLCSGRVEVLYNQTWGWLSDRWWDRLSADVVCRELHCGPSLEALKGDLFGPGFGPFLHKLACTGAEDDISQCFLGHWGEDNQVKNYQSAGVTCLQSGVQAVRLVNGSGRCDGIVELTLNNQPGRICAWHFDLVEAAVLCRHMGCGPLTQTIHTLEEVSSGVQMVEKMKCSGAESKVSECKVSLWRPEACYMNVHAGLVCSTEGLSKVTLVGGDSVCSGQLKVQVNGSSSRVCTDEWSQMEEVVVCRHMGCGPVLELKEGKKMVTLSKPTVDIQRLSCNGNEPDLSHCAAILSKGYKCNTEAADVLCSQTTLSNVALVNGTGPCSGRVEVFYREAWGTVCDQHWDLHDANVVCKQLGCGAAVEAPGGAFFGPGSGPVWLEKVFCNGSESALSECGALTSKRGRCAHAQDAGVICTGRKHAARDVTKDAV